MMAPSVRKAMLTFHVISTIGWIGAVVVFLALSLLALTLSHEAAVRGIYLAMEPSAWAVLVPFAAASLVSGVVQSLGTPWGLFRHYWIVFKFLIAIFITVILLLYMRTFATMAATAADMTIDLAAVRNPSPVIHATLAVLALLVAAVLAVYKPRGAVRRRASTLAHDLGLARTGAAVIDDSLPRWVRIFRAVALLIVLVFVVLLATRGHQHGRLGTLRPIGRFRFLPSPSETEQCC